MKSQGQGSLWAGRILSALAVLPFILSCLMKFKGGPQVVDGMGHYGWQESMLIPLGILEATCVLLYLIPPVSVLGGILLTGFLGGAVATHVRVGEHVYIHVVIGFLIWGGLMLREKRLRELLPLRSDDFKYERGVTINQPLDTVFAYLRPLRNFQNWNPFLVADSQVKLEYHGTDEKVGFVGAWEGNSKVGAGEQEITKIIDGQKVEFELRFKKPFAATNMGYFATEALSHGQTRVTWGMTGKNMFPMNLIGLFINCDKMMGKQFDSGLNRLKTILEKEGIRKNG